MRNAVLSTLWNYINGWITREQFEDWFIPTTWDAKLDHETRQLVNRIKLRLAEFLNGDWTEEELKSELAALAPAPAVGTTISWSSGGVLTTTSTTTMTGPIDWTGAVTVTVIPKSSATMVRMAQSAAA